MTITVRSNEPQTEKAAPASVGTQLSETAGSKEPTSAPEADASDKKQSSESEIEETEENEGENTESDSSEESQESEKDEVKDAKGKKKGGFQRRIDKLSAQKTAAQQEAEYWKQQALKGASESKQASTVETKAASSEGKPDPAKFETHSEYFEALTDWKTEQKLNERDQKLEKSKIENEQKKTVQTYQERAKAFAEKNADFDEALADVDDIVISPAVRDIILTSENGPELAYELAKNRDEFARICKLPSLAAAREIGKIESRLTPKSSSEKTESKKITSAPKPLAPVGTGGKGSTPKSIFDPNLSQSEYERLRKEQIKKRRQA